MACCILGAIIMGQLLAAWRARHRFLRCALALGLVICSGLLVWQIDQHRMHIQQLEWDLKAMASGQDPALAALKQAPLDCKTSASPAAAYDAFDLNAAHHLTSATFGSRALR